MTANTYGFNLTASNVAINTLTSNPNTITFGPATNSCATITTRQDNTLHVKGDVVVEGGDLTIEGVSIKKLLQGVADRLNILIPDPIKLEKHEALKRAYEQYKLLEALCHEDKKS